MFDTLAAHPWAYPALEIVHLIGVALLLGGLLVLELRLWGASRELAIGPLARLTLPMVGMGFGLALLSGLLMFATQAQELLNHRIFLAKMGLLMLAGTNAALFHARQGLQRLDTLTRLQTALSVMLWLGVLAAGRLIAYV